MPCLLIVLFLSQKFSKEFLRGWYNLTELSQRCRQEFEIGQELPGGFLINKVLQAGARMYRKYIDAMRWCAQARLRAILGCMLVLVSCAPSLHQDSPLQALVKAQLTEYRELAEKDGVSTSINGQKNHARPVDVLPEGTAASSCKGHGNYASPLFSRSDKHLQDFIESLVSSQPYKNLVKKGDLAITLIDLKSPCVASAGINEHQMFYAASIPKLVILLGLIRRFQDGSLAPSLRLLSLANEMIRVSSNSAASTLYHELGPVYLISLLFLEPYAFYDPSNGGGLWIGKEYGGQDALLRDPLEGFSHAATTWQVARFYLLLERSKLLNAPEAQLMRRILQDPGLPNKFVKVLSIVAPQATLLRKSGGWGDYQGDSIVVRTDTLHYILVALVKSEVGDSVLEGIAGRVHTFMQTR